MEICRVIRALRESQELTAEEVAFRLGVDTSTITRVERGERRLSTDLLQAIAGALNLGVTDIYALVEGREVLPAKSADFEALSDVNEVLLRLRRVLLKLPPDQRGLLLELAQTLEKTLAKKM
jgi:transcriptional regulator with XRE-family HTH domain